MTLDWTKRLAAFAADVRGGTAVTFGLLAIPLAVIALGAIDFARLSVLHQQLQDAVDTAALMAARSPATTDAELDQVGDNAFLGHMKKTSANLIGSTFKSLPDNGVEGSAEGTITPIILGLIGKGDLKAKVTTQVKRAQGTPAEVVLVLDTTGSMSGQPLADQKKAATSLVTELFKNSDGKNLKVGIVPFGQYVNVGVSRRNESWISVPADYTETIPAGACTWKTQTTCTGKETYSCPQTNDGRTTARTCTRNTGCVTVEVKPRVQVCPTPTTRTHKFYGCVGSPNYPKNVRDDDPSRVYPGFLDLTCNSEITLLTADQKTVTDAISALNAKGLTYIPAGLAWGFNMLSQPKPLTEAAAYDKSGQNLQPRKALVLMTDGANTVVMNTANGRHDKTSGSLKQADDYTDELCDNIKKQKIEVFTVAFQLDDKKAKTMIEGCATDADHFFDASDASKLQTSFARIAEALRSVYIAH